MPNLCLYSEMADADTHADKSMTSSEHREDAAMEHVLDDDDIDIVLE